MNIKRIRKSTPELDEALIKARLVINAVEKSQRGNFGNYADINDVIEAIEKQLLTNGISWYHHYIWRGEQEFFRTALRHGATGQERDIIHPVVFESGKNPMQARGGFETYTKRYALSDLLGLRGSDDVDPDAAPVTKSTFTPKTQSNNVTVTAELLLKLIGEHVNATPILANYKDKFGNVLTPANASKKVTYLPQADKNKLYTELTASGDKEEEADFGTSPFDQEELPF